MVSINVTNELSPEVIAAHEHSLKLALGDGCRKNLNAAISPMRQAAEGGHPYAQANLGLLCAIGEGTDKDFREALRWLTAAAEQGIAQSISNLAQLMEAGKLPQFAPGNECLLEN